MYKANFSCKKYITRTWVGLREFFTKYTGALPGMRERLSLSADDLSLITDCTTGYGRLDDIITELETVTKGFRDTRLQVVAQKDT
ncbi:MAG: hypothetical protein LBK71_06560, partial [Verrucomicrobiales bacterium]|nr:hypothetical protein [Verrucomicrobiales bacterium]